uniref:Uncharacterized protein n=1 Tax=Knipowitschia caucasica TaxID=637954 RepID=A0AAV2LRJ0_KNICA
MPDSELFGAVLVPDSELFGAVLVPDSELFGAVLVPGSELFGAVLVPDSELFGAVLVPDSELFGAVLVPDSELFGAVLVPDSELFGAALVPDSELFGAVLVPDSELFGAVLVPASEATALFTRREVKWGEATAQQPISSHRTATNTDSHGSDLTSLPTHNPSPPKTPFPASFCVDEYRHGNTDQPPRCCYVKRTMMAVFFSSPGVAEGVLGTT